MAAAAAFLIQLIIIILLLRVRFKKKKKVFLELKPRDFKTIYLHLLYTIAVDRRVSRGKIRSQNLQSIPEDRQYFNTFIDTRVNALYYSLLIFVITITVAWTSYHLPLYYHVHKTYMGNN
jgi:hypothetical protein